MICIPFFDYYWIATASPREDRLCVIASVSEAIQDYINSFLNIYLDRHVRFTHSRRQNFRSLLGELSSGARLRGFRNQLVIASASEAIQIKIKLFWVLSGSPRSFHSLAKTEFSLPARGAVKRSETEGLSIQDNLITRNLLDLITNLSRFFKFPCLDRFIKLDFEILENNFFFSFSCSLEFLYFPSCKRSKILI